MSIRWKKIFINGEETKYEISDSGLYRSSWNRRPGLRNMNTDNAGYPLAYIYHNNKRYTLKIHRLVCEAFVENPNSYDTVNHKNGKKNFNHYTNLEWCTRSMNTHHAYSIGTKKPIKGREHYLAQPVGNYKDGKLIKRYESCSEAREDGFDSQLISQSVRLGCRHKGFHWKHLDKEPIKETICQ